MGLVGTGGMSVLQSLFQPDYRQEWCLPTASPQPFSKLLKKPSNTETVKLFIHCLQGTPFLIWFIVSVLHIAPCWCPIFNKAQHICELGAQSNLFTLQEALAWLMTTGSETQQAKGCAWGVISPKLNQWLVLMALNPHLFLSSTSCASVGRVPVGINAFTQGWALKDWIKPWIYLLIDNYTWVLWEIWFPLFLPAFSSNQSVLQYFFTEAMEPCWHDIS